MGHNIFIEFVELSDKVICHYLKDQNAATGTVRHMLETGSLN